MLFFCKQQADWWLPNGRTGICCSFRYLCLQDGKWYSGTFKPLSYKLYVDDTYVGRKKNETDELYNVLNLYHQNIKLTLELDPIKLSDTEIIRSNGKITTQVCNKMKKLPVHWTSKILVRYKRNAIIGGSHRAKKIASNFGMEIKRVVVK